jgi:cytochrome c peroxidase
VGVNGTDNYSGTLHAPEETGMNGAYAARTANKAYRTTPLRGLWHPPQLTGPYFHDGSAKTLDDVVGHYVSLLDLRLTPMQRSDLVEYLKTL